jgi:hypothetical protein
MKFLIILSIIILALNLTKFKKGDQFIFQTKADIKQYNYDAMRISSENSKTITQVPILIIANIPFKSVKLYMFQSNDELHRSLRSEIVTDFQFHKFSKPVSVLEFDIKYCNSLLSIYFKSFGKKGYFFNLVNRGTSFNEDEKNLLNEFKSEFGWENGIDDFQDDRIKKDIGDEISGVRNDRRRHKT